jgi:site-specific DNA-methyltransferase (adenine-specific)
MCGDSTDGHDIANLMGGVEADMLLTDPPYNVGLGVGDTPEIAKVRKRSTDGLKIQNDLLEKNEFAGFLYSAFSNAEKNMKKGGAYYCWYASTSQMSFQSALEASGLAPHQILIWEKSSLVMGRQDYQWKHEPCFYGWKEGAGHYFADLRTETTVIPDAEEINPKKMKKDELVELCRTLLSDKIPTTVINEEKPSRSEEHPTMKPVKLFARLIKNSSRQGETVLDTFGGSGTTIIACEQLGRRCFMMELDPKYCDVIIERWEKFTGKKAELIT